MLVWLTCPMTLDLPSAFAIIAVLIVLAAVCLTRPRTSRLDRWIRLQAVMLLTLVPVTLLATIELPWPIDSELKAMSFQAAIAYAVLTFMAVFAGTGRA